MGQLAGAGGPSQEQFDTDVGGEINYFVTLVLELDYNTLGY